MSTFVWMPAMGNAAISDPQAIDISVAVPASPTHEVVAQIERVTITGQNALVEYSVSHGKFYNGASGYGAYACARIPVPRGLDPQSITITKKEIDAIEINNTISVLDIAVFLVFNYCAYLIINNP